MSATHLRMCSACAAHITTPDPDSGSVYCPTCRSQRPTWTEWSTNLSPGNRCYTQPIAAWHGMSRSEHVIIDRTGDQVTVQIVGLPDSRRQVRVTDLCQHDVTGRPSGGWLR